MYSYIFNENFVYRLSESIFEFKVIFLIRCPRFLFRIGPIKYQDRPWVEQKEGIAIKMRHA